ncbi:MAG: ribonuclease HI [Candidatus Pacebacteria bacterium]|nr:ribonuclease HI [Candidatus Paceibacterota bacterium]MCF7857456.1 ribonuclease HI [Candidatus Paceibacterota bacterium]
MKTVIIYCDGSSIGNPGPGGWGAVVLYESGKNIEELGGYVKGTTNNRMELTAAIEALNKLKEKKAATIKTDSMYVINGITKWVFGWEKNGWQSSQKKEVLNKDLWQELMKVSEKHTVTWEHVRGHEGVTFNERADMIANGYARKEVVKLFVGSEDKYKEFLKDMPKARVVSSSSSSKKGKTYSYVSLVEGKVEVHKAWAECEKRVKGKKAKYKKVFSTDEEKALIELWSA